MFLMQKQATDLDEAKANSSLKSNGDIDQQNSSDQESPPENALGRETVDQEDDDDKYHDSKAEDLYDLYNACNGVLHEGLLDMRKLDELSQEEAEVLDLARLREVWEHIASGCDRCQAIINTLNSVRERMRKHAAEPGQE